MTLIIIIIIIVIIIIIAAIFKRIVGGTKTTYTSSPSWHISDDISPEVLIDELTNAFMYYRDNRYFNDDNFKQQAIKYTQSVENKWRNIAKSTNEKERYLGSLYYNVLKGFSEISHSLTNLSCNNQINFNIVLITFVEAIVACAVNKDILLRNFSVPSGANGSYNMVILCEDQNGKKYALRIYKEDDIGSDSMHWNEHYLNNKAINDVFTHMPGNIIALPVYSSLQITHGSRYKLGKAPDLFGVYWMLMPQLGSIKTHLSSSSQIARKRFIIDYLKLINTAVNTLHANKYVYGDWKWDNTMISLDTNKPLISDTDFVKTDDLAINDKSPWIAVTHDYSNFANDLTSVWRNQRRNGEAIDRDQYIKMIMNYDTYIAIREALLTVIVLGCDRTFMNMDEVLKAYYSGIGKHAVNTKGYKYIRRQILKGRSSTYNDNITMVCNAILDILNNDESVFDTVQYTNIAFMNICINKLIAAVEGEDIIQANVDHDLTEQKEVNKKAFINWVESRHGELITASK